MPDIESLYKNFLAKAGRVVRSLWSTENLLALLLALLLIAIYIATAADAPLWVYQGF